jgi:hypothetical protein
MPKQDPRAAAREIDTDRAAQAGAHGIRHVLEANGLAGTLVALPEGMPERLARAVICHARNHGIVLWADRTHDVTRAEERARVLWVQRDALDRERIRERVKLSEVLGALDGSDPAAAAELRQRWADQAARIMRSIDTGEVG